MAEKKTTAFNNITGDDIKTGMGSKGSNQSKFESGWDAIWAKKEAPTERPLTFCAANRDGECSHKQCPQLRDNEPAASGRHCPIDSYNDY